MPQRSFRVDAQSAQRLANAIEQQKALLLPEVHKVTLNAGRKIRKSAGQNWPYTGRTRFFSKSFTTKTTKKTNGSEVEIYSRSPFGTIFSYGARGFAGKDVLYEALDEHYEQWKADLANVLQQTILGNPNIGGGASMSGAIDGGGGD